MVDYSKWKDIEISDDEDEVHPNIDTSSLFRWRHEARVKRMEDSRRDHEEHEQKKKENIRKLTEVKNKIAELGSDSPDMESLKKALEELEKEEKDIVKIDEEMKKKEEKTPWNIDTISEPGFTKTVINTKPAQAIEETLTEEEKDAKTRKFVLENEKLLNQYGRLRRYDDSKNFLQEHNHLVCESAATYLVIWCINLEVEEKHGLMAHVAHQTICMQYILKLAKQLDIDPRGCVSSFFSRIQVAEKTYKDAFDRELTSFKARVKKRAVEKIEAVLVEQKKARLGPGGLDPVEVFAELPEEMKTCFVTQNVPMLQETLAKMPEQEAVYFMKKCMDSGMWAPGKNDDDSAAMPKCMNKAPGAKRATSTAAARASASSSRASSSRTSSSRASSSRASSARASSARASSARGSSASAARALGPPPAKTD